MKAYTYECAAISAGKGVNVFSDFDVYSYFREEKFSREHIALNIFRNQIKTSFGVYYHNDSLRTLRYYEKEVHIVCPWEQTGDGHILLYAAYPFFEFQRQKSGYVSAYSAAVALKGKGILFFGKIGAGKTSLSLDLCRRYGAVLIGNDLTIVGLENQEIYLKEGTKFFFLRYESVRRNMPVFLSLFPEKPEDSWLCKVKVAPEQLGIQIARGEILADKIYLVHIDESSTSLLVQKDDTLVTKLFLNENFSRYIRGTSLALLVGEKLEFLGYVPSYDKIEFYDFRVRLIEAIMSRIFYISGSLNAVSDYIANQIF